MLKFLKMDFSLLDFPVLRYPEDNLLALGLLRSALPDEIPLPPSSGGAVKVWTVLHAPSWRFLKSGTWCGPGDYVEQLLSTMHSPDLGGRLGVLAEFSYIPASSLEEARRNFRILSPLHGIEPEAMTNVHFERMPREQEAWDVTRVLEEIIDFEELIRALNEIRRP